MNDLSMPLFLIYIITFLSHCCLEENTKKVLRPLVLKKILFLLYLLAILACMLCYWRHVTHCEPGVYSLFSILEYVVVILNISLHGTAALDFREDVLCLPSFKMFRNEK